MCNECMYTVLPWKKIRTESFLAAGDGIKGEYPYYAQINHLCSKFQECITTRKLRISQKKKKKPLQVFPWKTMHYQNAIWFL